jgi:hypothetical protein
MNQKSWMDEKIPRFAYLNGYTRYWCAGLAM